MDVVEDQQKTRKDKRVACDANLSYYSDIVLCRCRPGNRGFFFTSTILTIFLLPWKESLKDVLSNGGSITCC